LWCDQVPISWAATVGPTPGSSSSAGTVSPGVEQQVIKVHASHAP
jgi:hypothetical protein